MRYICDHCGKVEEGQKPSQFASFVAHQDQTLGLCGKCKQGPRDKKRAKALRDGWQVYWLALL